MNSPTTFGVLALNWPPRSSIAQVLFTPVDTVREVYARYARRDFARVFELLSPDVEITQASELPWGGRFNGLSGAHEFFARLNLHTDGAPDPVMYMAAGNEVAVVGRHRGCARSTGKAFDVSFVHIWTVRAGRMTRWAAFVDTPLMQEAVGIS